MFYKPRILIKFINRLENKFKKAYLNFINVKTNHIKLVYLKFFLINFRNVIQTIFYSNICTSTYEPRKETFREPSGKRFIFLNKKKYI